MKRRKAKLFWTGRSQAVRLPKEFRFEGDTVMVRREGDANRGSATEASMNFLHDNLRELRRVEGLDLENWAG
jgi:Antidote-toxin recognition MazE, bacterial antitoxin